MADATEAGREKLIRILDAVAETGREVAEEVNATTAPQPTANAASICRWKLLTLKERLHDVEGPRRVRSARAEAIHHLDAAAAAAQRLSYGYRLHNLDRICDGGQALDDHLAALARLRARLDSQH
ncbi:MAG TPA: hypothetical protein VFC51_14660 [Chloroflexota bacterium]|nr:hypothetical protein [Chloroflexota bacterium]